VPADSSSFRWVTGSHTAALLRCVLFLREVSRRAHGVSSSALEPEIAACWSRSRSPSRLASLTMSRPFMQDWVGGSDSLRRGVLLVGPPSDLHDGLIADPSALLDELGDLDVRIQRCARFA
jgi:hypothetical protein